MKNPVTFIELWQFNPFVVLFVGFMAIISFFIVCFEFANWSIRKLEKKWAPELFGEGVNLMEMNDSQRHINQDVKKILLQTKKSEVAFKGTVLEGKERRYTVLNERDRQQYLSQEENEELESMLYYYLGKIETGRAQDGKEPFNSYLIINTDEPYADEIVEVLNRNGHWK